ncbi:MAG TPA: hypothetical protein VJ836_01335 [Candidatus Saccharimonadales bacterium]|nr:hypothetical protein [Candidatus Saccharimonadales bacterium]
MTPEAYIHSKLESLGKPLGLEKPANDEQLAEVIFKLIMSKKFRKYSVNPEYIEHIKSAIRTSIKNQEPINVTFVFGGYKLWRLNEAPEVDWAELFSILYYANWARPICEVYKPGLWFDFFSDDVIIPRLNNISDNDTRLYRQSFAKLLKYVRPYLPANLRMTFNRVRDQYESQTAFEADLADQIKSLKQNLPNGLPELTDELFATLELNVKLTSSQQTDPLWGEKVQLVHDGYAQVTKRRPYYRTPDKIMAVTKSIPNSLAVGTTKDSVMKFWIGSGVLRRHGEEYRQLICSPRQLENLSFTWHALKVSGLEGKNFSQVRVCE